MEEVINAVDMAATTGDIVVSRFPILAVRLLLAGLVILMGVIALRLGRMAIERLIRHPKNEDEQRSRQIRTLRSIITSVFSYLLFFALFIVVLSIFGVNVKNVLAMASISGIAIGFASQTLIKDVIFGLFIWAEGSIGVGDIVRINDLDGTIDSISIRTTIIKNYNGNVYTIPNGEIRTITNMSVGFQRAIVDIRCPYEARQSRLMEIIKDEMNSAAHEIDGISGEPDIMNVYAFEPDAVMVRVAVQCAAREHWRIERELRARIKNRFDNENIIMPHYTGSGLCSSAK